MWQVTYHLKPLSYPGFNFGMRSMAFQCEHPPFLKEANGFYATTLLNVPAFREEPYMPPEDAVKAWMLIYYEADHKLDAAKFWKEQGKTDYQRFKPLMKADSAVKNMAQEVSAEGKTAEDKLRLLDGYCRTKVKNVWNRSSEMTAEQKKQVKENKNPGDTLKQMAGTGMDVALLFGAMAQSLGMDVRMARVPDRNDAYFMPQRTTTYFMQNMDVAVNVDGKWRFYDPQTSFLERGFLRWQEEGQQALVSDPKEGFFVATQYSEPAKSMRRRRGTFSLREDGTLEGSVVYEYTGHVARGERTRVAEMSASQREEDWKESLVNRLSTAQLSDLQFKNLEDADKPLSVTHKISVPGYAIRTGKRILLQPAFFERNFAARFTEATRKYDVSFNFPWSETDDITIQLPEGWELDQPSSPGAMNIANVGKYESGLRKTTDGRTLFFHRQFEWGYEMRLLFPAASYPQLKKVFEDIHTLDSHGVTLKPAAVTGAK
ncbi:MAG: hypothetical protein ABI823_17295, partial [Bryobacteraceae bacterium]